VGLAAALLGRRDARPAVVVLVGVLGLQLLLGVLNVVLGLPLPLAMAHHAGAVGLLVTLVWCYQRCGFREERRYG
jgi:cytochrome c oxidase assembly protein subunit 15